MKREKDIEGVVKRQKRYATLAKKEGKYALKKEREEVKEGAKEMAHDSAREAKVAFQFAKKRKAIAKKEENKLKQ